MTIYFFKYRIERLWRDVFKCYGCVLQHLALSWGTTLLDISSILHIFCCHASRPTLMSSLSHGPTIQSGQSKTWLQTSCSRWAKPCIRWQILILRLIPNVLKNLITISCWSSINKKTNILTFRFLFSTHNYNHTTLAFKKPLLGAIKTRVLVHHMCTVKSFP